MNKKRRQRLKRYYCRMGLLFTVCVGTLAAANLMRKDKTFSEKENRILAEKPEITAGRLADGSYMKAYEDYYTDQFIGRDFFVRLKAGADLLAGRRMENGVYKGKDHYLMEEIRQPDKEAMRDNLAAMKHFRKACPDINFRLLLVPDAANILKDKLPAFSTPEDQNAWLSDIKKEMKDEFIWMDARKILEKKKEEDIYYHTDHHWTTQAAYEVFKDQAEELGLDSKHLVKMELKRVTEDFNGTLSAASGYETGYKEPVFIAVPEKKEVEYVVTYPEEGRKEATIYDSSKLKEKDKYAVFFGGNHPEAAIHTTSDSTARLLLIKDSYANCFVQFLLPYYREIVMVDPRYYSGSLKTVMTEHQISDVLFLYNMNTFAEDNNISGVLEEYGEDTAE